MSGQFCQAGLYNRRDQLAVHLPAGQRSLLCQLRDDLRPHRDRSGNNQVPRALHVRREARLCQVPSRDLERQEGDCPRVPVRRQLRLDAAGVRGDRVLLRHLPPDHPLRPLLLSDQARGGQIQHLLRLQTIKDQQEHPRLRCELCLHLAADPTAHASLLQHNPKQE